MFHFAARRRVAPKQEPSSSGARRASANRSHAEASPLRSSNNPKATAESAPAASPSASRQRASCFSSGSGSSLAGAASQACRSHVPKHSATSTLGSPSASLSRQMAFSSIACRRVSAAAAGAGACSPASPSDSGGSRTLLKQRKASRSMLRSMNSLPNSRHCAKCAGHSFLAALWDSAASQAITASFRRPSDCSPWASSAGCSETSYGFSFSSWK
mmetsp:Transcript_104498/g.325867  ORF Transcript_104498/g.325867 Transcript_104498/m.325867 type:complete len:215 (+) Transcript_104498:423-1067(+)